MSTNRATREVLLAIARRAIEAVVQGTGDPPVSDLPILDEYRGVFVTLTRAGRLRGCIGRIEPDIPLSALLPLMAVLAATEDPRFPAVSADELGLLRVELSLLTPLVPISGPADIEIGRHGLVVFARGKRGVLLPGVASQFDWSADEFLAQTCRKAMLPAHAWRDAATRIHRFETEVIAE